MKCKTKRQIKTCLLKRYDTCCYCGVSLNITNATIENIIPHSLGGRWVDIACFICNQRYNNIYTCWTHFECTGKEKYLYKTYELLMCVIHQRQRVRNPILDLYPAICFLIGVSE